MCGGANNQLAAARHAAALAARGILFVPDYIANAGGVIDFHQERIGDDSPDAVLGAVARIHDITRDVLGGRRTPASRRSGSPIGSCSAG